MRRPIITTIFMLVLLLTVSITRAAPPTIGGCQVFPANNPWNADISGAAVDPKSSIYITLALQSAHVHPDFGSDPAYGIPYVLVSGSVSKVPITFDIDDESDPGPYPFPTNAPVEGGGDRHVLAIDIDHCVLYETWDSHYVGGAQHAWNAGSGAIFNLDSNALRPAGFTSADAAGLPIFPGLARCDEAMSGTINHALRLTMANTRNTYIYPATHQAGSNNSNLPPMGQRYRLRSTYTLPNAIQYPQAHAIAQALQTYGLILADNGSNWYISGETDRNNCWNDNDLNQLKLIPGNQFEAIVSPAPVTGVTIQPPTLYSPAPGAPVSGTTQPILDWNTVTGADRYQIRFDRNNPPTAAPITVQATQITEYTPPTPLVTGFTYYWQVRAIDDGDAFTTPTTTAYSAPQSFVMASPDGAAPIRNRYTTVTPTFTWNRVTGAVKYHIQVSKNSTFSGTLVYEDTFPKTGLPLLNLYYTMPSGKLTLGTYYWRVQACSSATSCTGAWTAAEPFLVDV